jgi:hypothetical protein
MNESKEDRDLERLSELLDALPAPQPSAALLRAVAEIPLRNPKPAPRFGFGAWSPLRSGSRVALSMVVIALLGALSGGLSADDDDAGVYDGTDDWSDLSALSLATDLDQELEP